MIFKNKNSERIVLTVCDKSFMQIVHVSFSFFSFFGFGAALSIADFWMRERAAEAAVRGRRVVAVIAGIDDALIWNMAL